MNPDLLGNIILVGLRILETIIKDQPAADRQKSWDRWFRFVDKMEAWGDSLFKSEPPVPPTPKP